MTIELLDRVEGHHLDDLMDLYKGTYWAKDRTAEDVRRMLGRTDLVFAAVDSDSGQLVAFARVLTDTVYKAFIFDVIVHPRYRGEGLAKRLLDSIMAHPELQEVKHFELYCKDDVVELYRRWGFSTDLGGQVFMRRDGRRT
jgi:GNAT superfamily N-acetyltransferase